MKPLFILAVLYIFLANIFEAYASPPRAYEGRRLFVSYCQLCHGPTGLGDGPLAKKMNITPADLTTTIRSRSDTILKKIISGQGKQTITGRDRHNLLSDTMPEWSKVFSEPQIDALIAFLRFLSRSKHPLTGNPEVGYNLYQKYCSMCHGEEGEGDGVMTKIMEIEPADHTNIIEMDPLSNHQLVNIIRKGKGQFMPAWDGILSQGEIDTLVSYIRLISNL
jgi:cbb3-type cytochrome c oxidase subunit III